MPSSGSGAFSANDSLLAAPPVPVPDDGGLLNEVGPQYIGRADFFKIDVNKHPKVAVRYTISSVPTPIVFKKGTALERYVWLFPLNPLKAWIERHIEGGAAE